MKREYNKIPILRNPEETYTLWITYLARNIAKHFVSSMYIDNVCLSRVQENEAAI